MLLAFGNCFKIHLISPFAEHLSVHNKAGAGASAVQWIELGLRLGDTLHIVCDAVGRPVDEEAEAIMAAVRIVDDDRY